MKPLAWFGAGVGTGALLMLLALGRYAVVSTPGTTLYQVQRLDRLTGRTWGLDSQFWYEVVEHADYVKTDAYKEAVKEMLARQLPGK